MNVNAQDDTHAVHTENSLDLDATQMSLSSALIYIGQRNLLNILHIHWKENGLYQ